MFSVWTSVTPVSETHERAGEAGTVWKVNKAKFPTMVVVKWDKDETIEVVDAADLKELG